MRLTLFFTRGNSLATWDRAGSLDREVAIYRRLQTHGVKVAFVTYGDTTDFQYANRISGIDILCNRYKLPLPLYESFIPLLHASFLRQSDVIKTNQARGAHTALYAARLWRKPLIVRFGYSWSKNTARRLGTDSIRTRLIRQVESLVFKHAERIVVTTPAMRQEILQRFPEMASRVLIIPNYVDTDRFFPRMDQRREKELLFVGRLSPEKNLAALLEAVQSLEMRLTIIGDGKLRAELQSRFESSGERLHLQGIVPQSEIPVFLNRSSIFILPSLYEGHPKALIEAMACGLPVIGTDVTGIRDLIRHGETGWLCATDSDSIRAAIEHLLAQPKLCAQLGQNARQFVLDNFSLDQIVEIELDMLHQVAGL